VRGPAWPGSASAYAAHVTHGLAQLGPGLRGHARAQCARQRGTHAQRWRLHRWWGEAAARCLPAVSDRVDGGVGDVDGEAWMALGHAWLSSDLRGTTAKR
jgi:hypothetical protein